MSQQTFARRCTIYFLLTIAALPSAAFAQAEASSADRARQILKAMSDFVSVQQSLSGEFDLEIDVVTPEIQKIQFSSTGSVVLARPDSIHTLRKGGKIDLNLIFDGKTVTLIDRTGSSYATLAAPGTIESTMKLLRSDFGIEMPATNLVLTNSYDSLMAGVFDAKYIGTETIEGQECEHLAFRDAEADWQLWVRKGDRPFPCKYIILSKTIVAAPGYAVRYRNWTTGQIVPRTMFQFAPSKTSKLVPFDQMSSLGALLAPTTASTELHTEP